jgi:hypothetical protein
MDKDLRIKAIDQIADDIFTDLTRKKKETITDPEEAEMDTLQAVFALLSGSGNRRLDET